MAKKLQDSRDDVLEAAIARIRDSIPVVMVEDDQEDMGSLTTGSIAVDSVTQCGGFPRGRVTEVSGWEASGKTTLALEAAAQCQRIGGYVVFIDSEWALDRPYATKLGFDTYDQRKCLYTQPETFEDAAEIAQTMVDTGKVDLMVLDSVSALMPADAEGESQTIKLNEAMGKRARMMSVWMPKLIQQARRGKTAIVLINQLRDVIHANTFLAKFGDKTTTSGGKAVRFYASLRLEATQRRKGSVKRAAVDPISGKEIDLPVGNEHSIKCAKNKVGASNREAPFFIRYDEHLDLWGVDNIQSLLDMSVVQGHIIQKSAGFFDFGDGRQLKGEAKAHKFLLESPEVCAALATKLGLDWANYAPPGREKKA